jgi:hypothetical protein
MDHLPQAAASIPAVRSIGTAHNDNHRIVPSASRPLMRTIRLSAKCARDLTAWAQARDVADLSGPRLLHATREGAGIIESHADDHARDAMDDFATCRLDVVAVENLYEVCNLEPTVNNCDPAPASRKYALVLGALGLRCGMLPSSVSTENKAVFDRHVVTKGGLESEKRSDGGAEIGPHSEHASNGHGHRGVASPAVDTLCLGGLRNPDAEPTGFALLEDALELVPRCRRDLLEQPIWGFDPPESSSRNGTMWGLPILMRRRGRFEIAYRDDKVHIPDVPGAQEAINSLRGAIRKTARSIVLSPGTAWLAFNPRTLHWRDPVRNRDRWLIRTFGYAASTAVVQADPAHPEIVEY